MRLSVLCKMTNFWVCRAKIDFTITGGGKSAQFDGGTLYLSLYFAQCQVGKKVWKLLLKVSNAE